MKNRRLRYICLLLGICALLFSACSKGKKEEDTSPAEKGNPLNPAGETSEQTPSEEDKEASEEENPEDEAADKTEKEEAEKTQGEGAKPFWQSEASRMVSNLTAIASAGQTDYKVNGAKRGWMSKNGRLYSYYDGTYINTDTLVADGYLEGGLTPSEYEILLINGSDLALYDGTSVPKESMNFGVFAASKQSGKYLLASSAGKAGQISEENYRQLLDKYNQSNGQVVRLSSASAEYDRILNYISLFEGRFDEYYVREIRKDNKYAVVVFSGRQNTADIKEYILKNDNNFWEVVLPNAQTEYYPHTAINRYLPDFNMELLPGYNLATWRGSILSEQGGAVAALFSGEYITTEEEIAYQCATANCAYIVLQDGSRFACYKEGGIWRASPVDSDVGAVRILQSKTGANYGFLVLDD